MNDIVMILFSFIGLIAGEHSALIQIYYFDKFIQKRYFIKRSVLSFVYFLYMNLFGYLSMVGFIEIYKFLTGGL